MPRGAAVHYLRESRSSGQSRRHVVFDTEARFEYDGHIQRQSWLCGVARFLDRDTRLQSPSVGEVVYEDPDSLWRDIAGFTRGGTRTLVWAHNLAYDIRISRALQILPTLGWELGAIALDGQSAWAKFTWGDHTLVLCDFTSWASVPLARIGGWLKIPQTPRPERSDDLGGAIERCKGDVRILAQAVVTTLDWLAANDLGALQITGSGQGMTAFRHRHLTHKMLVHDDEEAHRAERRAIWAGRTEAWRHGIYAKGETFEYDLPRAYATCARDLELPTVYVGKVSSCSYSEFQRWTKSRRLLCSCAIETRSPIAPTTNNDRILWPVGRYSSWLWDCEVQALFDHGARVTIGDTFVYTSEPCLHDWATWILARLSYVGGVDSPLHRRILKQWSRSLVGRFAMQYRGWDDFGTSPDADLSLTRMIGPDERPGARLLQVGHKLFNLSSLRDSENPLPQITGYITAACRVRLWDLMCEAGTDHVYYTDTDSLIVDALGRRRLEARIAKDGAHGLVSLGQIGRLELNGPRQLAVDGHRRHSGVPMAARPAGSDVVVGEVWEGLGEALRRGHPNEVVVQERAFNLRGQDQRREWLTGGRTRAITLGDGAPLPPTG